MDDPPPRTAATSVCNSTPLATSVCDSSLLATSVCDSTPLATSVCDSSPLATSVCDSSALVTSVCDSTPLVTSVCDSTPLAVSISVCDSTPLAVSVCDSTPQAVSISVCDSTPLLWRVEDLRSVRARGLVGVLLGALPRTPRQNVRLGRPLLLLPEEEQLLTERHVGPPTAPPTGNQDGGVELQVQQYQEAQQRSYEEQSVLALEDRKSALLRAMTSSPTESGDESLRRRLAALESSFSFPRSAMAVQLSTARAGLSYCADTEDFLRADRPIRALDELRRVARYQVFRDLRGRGFYLTSAGKFGGDFLVYPGDPLRFHAHFIAVCVSLDESLSLLDVLAVSRLGSNVKKTVLLCSPGTDGRVAYTSLQWSGMV